MAPAGHKACPPSSIMVVLGFQFNTIDITTSISDRVDEIQAELEAWCNRAKMSHKQLESLTGKLQFASQVIRAGHVFLAHLLDELRGSPKKGYITCSLSLAPSSTWMPYWWVLGVCKGFYFHTSFPDFIVQQAHIIAHLELLAFIVALKAWPHLVSNTKFMAHLNNMVAVLAIKTSHSKDPFINAGLREIAFLSALHNFEV